MHAREWECTACWRVSRGEEGDFQGLWAHSDMDTHAAALVEAREVAWIPVAGRGDGVGNYEFATLLAVSLMLLRVIVPPPV